MFDKIRQMLGLRPEMNADKAFLDTLAAHLAASASGDGDAGGNLVLGNNQRDTFISFTALSRAVNIIAALSAQMVCNGGLRVMNGDGERVNNRRITKIMELLTYSPDGGITPAYSFIEDTMCDYLLDGNALLRPVTNSSGMAIALIRYRSHGAFTVRNADGPLAYQAQRALSEPGALEVIPASDIIHIRWPLLRRGSVGLEQREHFATAPVTLIAESLLIGMLQDRYTSGRFKNPVRSVVNINYDVELAPNMTPEQKLEVHRMVEERLAKSKAFSSFGANVTEITAPPVHESVVTGRTYQVEEVARFYGLPLPLLSGPIGQWTRGINEQVMKMAWRTGIRPHLDRLLTALQTRLLQPGERFEPDPTDMIRGDGSAIAELTNAWQGDAQRNPVASREEIRHMAGLPRTPEGIIVATINPDSTGIAANTGKNAKDK